VDNIKTLLDSCNGILWADDGLIADLHIMKAYDKEQPRVEMRVWELEPKP
jgi:Holliday junction resolvase RusA-like endonuclease